MEELFLKALLWIDNIEPQEGYMNLLHEIFMRPENEENQYLLDLEDCTNNKKDTHHVILSFVNSDQTSWDEELFIKLFMEYLRSRYEENESVHETMRIAYNLLRNLPVSSVRKFHKPLSTLDLAETYLGSDYPSQYSAYKAFFDSVYYYADESEKEAAFNKALEGERVERIEKRGYEFSDVNDDFMKALYFGINQGFIAVGKKYFVIFTGRICRITLISSIRQVVHFSELLYKDMISSNRMELERHYLRIEEFDGSNCIVLCFNSVAADFAIERFNEIGIFTSTIPTKRIPSSQSTRVS